MIGRSPLRALVLGAVLLTTPALAGPGHERGPDRDPAETVEKLQEHVGLDDATAQQVVTIMEAAHASGRALRVEGRELKDSMKALMDAEDWEGAEAVFLQIQDLKAEAHAAREAARAEVDALLTVEQRMKLRMAMHERRQHHRGHHARNGGRSESSTRF